MSNRSEACKPEALALVLPQSGSQLPLHPTAQRPLEAARHPPLHVQDGDGSLQAATSTSSVIWRQRSTPKSNISLRPPILHLQPPDAGALLGGLFHGAIHQGDEHVEQQDVGEDDVADEQHVEDLLVLVVLGELHVAHADGELEELQGGVGDVCVAGLDAAVIGFGEESGLGWFDGLNEQSDHRWEAKHGKILAVISHVLPCHLIDSSKPATPAENPKRKTT